MRAGSICSNPDCPNPTPCADHPKTAWQRSTRKQRLPPNWSTLRRLTRDRAGGRCEWTTDGQRCTAPGTDCDHRLAGDDHSLDNLQWLCDDHHKQKTADDNRRARMR